MGESGKDDYFHTNTWSETTYWWGTECRRMGDYDFPGQITGSDGSEDNGSMGEVFIVLENPV
jgi:hypothetical protein